PLDPGGARREESEENEREQPAHAYLLRRRHGPAFIREARLVLPAVVVLPLPGLDRLPPAAVLAIPGDGLPEPVLEAPLRGPAERRELRAIERVAAVVAETVLDVPDEPGVGTGELQDPAGQLEVLELTAADVVDLSGLPFAQDELDRGAVVADVDPLAPLPPVAVDGQRQ